MVHKLLRLFIVVFWFGATGYLVVDNVIRPGTMKPSYRPGRGRITKPIYLKMGIYVADRRTGILTQKWLPREDGTLLIEADVDATLVFFKPMPVCARMQFEVDAEGRLSTLKINMELPLKAEILGRMRTDGMYLVVDLGESRFAKFLPLESGGVMSTTFTPVLTLPPLKTGVQWELTRFDPIMRQTTTVWMKVEGRDIFTFDGEDLECFKVSIRDQYMADDPDDKLWVWVTPDEEILQIEKPHFYKLMREPWSGDQPRETPITAEEAS